MHSVDQLEQRLSQPSPALIADLGALDGDILVLGAGGKLGPSLVRLALRGAEGKKKIIAVSRFGDKTQADALKREGAEIVSADITDDAALAALPEARNIIFLVGSKFGSTGREADTWYTNAYLPGRVADRYRSSRIVALSTGNVYPFTPIGSGGPTEEDAPGPVGEYAMSCLGRERVLTRFAHKHQTPLALIRLNYAVEMRYGVLVDIGRKVRAGEPVDVAMAAVNVVWQGYANEVILRALGHATPDPFVLNLAGPETLSVRQLAQAFGAAAGVEPHFTGTEAGAALLSNSAKCMRLFGYPDVSPAALIEWTAAWLAAGLPLLDKPTGFQKRDGKF
ncbi:MAG: NAD(P)-dependent oxidoreductase [Devosia nanyangense]|uniref:NAD(P)-dependent oxidoreductase n=1 Tax=Devosia nanyangense TaxID=1228055 RepID=A0A933L5K1_9HYPH|nr:NAD(P)-dependent oxidoreductase [Devosia nanyangense]